MLAFATCYEALRARDARFDGLFFVGVQTTGIYCRSICSARTPRESSCRFYESAAAAEKGGFRPCLRCRPEVAPGADCGPERSLAQAIGTRLQATALEAASVGELARQVGFSERHLRRIVRGAYGVTPIELVQTQRLLFAKKLLQETALPVAAIALHAGFRSLRRFNALFLARYRLAPTALRHSAVPVAAGPLRLRLAYRPPLAWRELLAYFAARAMPGVETVADGCYLRTTKLGGQPGWLRVSPAAEQDALIVEFAPEMAAHLYPALHRLRVVFDLDADPARIAEHLSRDPMLRAHVAQTPGLRVPGAWEAAEIAVRAVLGQQVSVAGATTLSGRLVARFGTPLATPWPGLTHTFPEARVLAAADVGDIAALGLPRKRAETIRAVAAAAAAGAFTFPPGTSGDDAVAQWQKIPGVGTWTAQYLALRLLRSPDAFPAGDLGLRKAAGRGAPLTEAALLRHAERWRPWRAYAAAHLWQSLLNP